MRPASPNFLLVVAVTLFTAVFIAACLIIAAQPAHAGTITPIFGGGTGTSTAPAYGKVPVGDSNGNWEYFSTSSLNITGGGGSSASTTLLGDNNTFSGTDTFGSTIHGSVNGNANTATSLAANGTNCSAGFFALGVDASGNSEGCTYAAATSSPWTLNQFVYINSSGQLVSVASSSLDLPTSALASQNISQFTNNSGYITGNQSITLSGVVTGSGATAITTAFGSQSAGVLGNPATGNTAVQATSTLYGAVQSGKILAGLAGVLAYVSTTTAGTGLTYNGGASPSFSVNTSQNISTLSNLTSNGLIKTSSGTGALSIATNGTDYTLLTAVTCSNQLLSAETAAGVGTCSSINNADWSGTQLSEANGGTGATSIGASMLVANNGSSVLVSTSTPSADHYLATSTTQASVFPEASTTQVSSGSNTFYVDPNGNVTAKEVSTGFTGLVTPRRVLYLPFATSTGTWTATSSPGVDSAPTLPLPFNGTIKDVRCDINTFLGINIKISGTNVTPPYFIASSTIGTTTLTGNNTFTNVSYLNIYAGTTTTATASAGVVQGGCYLDIIQTS